VLGNHRLILPLVSIVIISSLVSIQYASAESYDYDEFDEKRYALEEEAYKQHGDLDREFEEKRWGIEDSFDEKRMALEDDINQQYRELEDQLHEERWALENAFYEKRIALGDDFDIQIRELDNEFQERWHDSDYSSVDHESDYDFESIKYQLEDEYNEKRGAIEEEMEREMRQLDEYFEDAMRELENDFEEKRRALDESSRDKFRELDYEFQDEFRYIEEDFDDKRHQIENDSKEQRRLMEDKFREQRMEQEKFDRYDDDYNHDDDFMKMIPDEEFEEVEMIKNKIMAKFSMEEIDSYWSSGDKEGLLSEILARTDLSRAQVEKVFGYADKMEDKHMDEFDKYGSGYQDEQVGNFYEFDRLEERVQELEDENKELRSYISDLEKKLEDFNQVIVEQIKVIYDWIIVR